MYIFTGQDLGENYVVCFYFVCTVFTTVGFGDIYIYIYIYIYIMGAYMYTYTLLCVHRVHHCCCDDRSRACPPLPRCPPRS